MIELNEVVKNKQKINTIKKVNINIRITKHMSDWISANNISPTALFNHACKELKYNKDIVLSNVDKVNENERRE